MRYISNLSAKTIKALEEKQKNGLKSRERNRAHAILLSNSGVTAKEISKIFGVSRRTVYRWFDRTKGNILNNLNDLSGRGRPSILNLEDLTLISKLMEDNNIKESCAILKSKYNIVIKPSTLKRFFKKTILVTSEQEKLLQELVNGKITGKN